MTLQDKFHGTGAALITPFTADNKVSLFVRYVNLEDSTEETRIVNKNK